MCIDLYVDKKIVYTDCAQNQDIIPSPSTVIPSSTPNSNTVPPVPYAPSPSIVPSPSIPSTVPSPSTVPYAPSPSTVSAIVPSPTPSPVTEHIPTGIVPSVVPSTVPSPYTASNVPSVTSPATNVVIDGYSLVTPSANTRTNTTMSPSSSNSSNMSMPFAENGSEFIHPEDNWTTILGIVAATVLPALFLCILAYKKKPKKCKKPNKVQPEMMKKKTRCCGCKKKPKLPQMKPYEDQPPLPVTEPVEENTYEPSAPPISLPPTPKGTE